MSSVPSSSAAAGAAAGGGGGGDGDDRGRFLWAEAPQQWSLGAELAALRKQLAAVRVRFGFGDALAAYRLNAAEVFAGDAAAGIVVAVMLIPQALAYAQLTGMPAVTGFFAAVLALFAYPVFGSSGQQAVGPVALLALMAQAAIAPVAEAGLAPGAPPAGVVDRFERVAAKLAFLIGVMQLGMGVLRAGYVLNFLSHAVLAGFTTSSALIIAASQLSKALGFSTPQRPYVWQTLVDIQAKLAAGKAHPLSIGLFVANMVLFYGLTVGRQRLMATRAVKSRAWLVVLMRVLSVALIVVALNILVVGGARLDLKGVSVLGKIPSGMPPFAPDMVFDGSFSADSQALLPSAVLITIVSFVESASVAKSMQNKFGITPGTAGANDNQELLGLGLANVATALFRGFPVTGGFSRSTVNAEAGARTVMAGVFSGTLLCLVVSFFTSWFYFLPDVALAALIIFSALRLLESNTIRFLLAVDRADALVWAATVGATLGAGIDVGLLVGASISVLRIVREAAVPHLAVLGRMPDGVTFRNVRRFPGVALPVPGLAIVRLDGPLFFANTSLFVETVVGAAFPPASSAAEAPLATTLAVIVDLSGVSSIDSAGVHTLSDTLPAELAKAAARRPPLIATKAKVPRVVFVAAHGPVRDRLHAGDRAHHRTKAHAAPPAAASAPSAASAAAAVEASASASASAAPDAAATAATAGAPQQVISDVAVSLSGLYVPSGSADAADAAGAASATSADLAGAASGPGALPPAVRAVLAHARPGSTEALRLLLQVDLQQGVEAVLAVLAAEAQAQAAL